MGRPRKLPPDNEVERLYRIEKLSTVQIARMYSLSDPNSVRRVLRRLGVPMRRHDNGTVFCVERGCKNRAHKIRHPGNGSLYGTRCLLHRKRHRNQIARNYTRKKRGIPEGRWRLRNL